MRFLFTMSDIKRPAASREARLPSTPSKREARQRTKPIKIASKGWAAAGPASFSRPIQDLWWSQTGSNRRPHACKARALPTELWPRFKTRRRPKAVVGLGGLEPPTSRLSSARSNQLSYKPGRKKKPTACPRLSKPAETQVFHILNQKERRRRRDPANAA